MTVDRVLAAFGLILALPGFLGLFFSGYQVEGFLCLALGAALLCIPLAIRWFAQLAPYTIIDAKVTLSFDRRSVKQAKVTKEYRIRANQRHLTALSLRNIAADGNVSDIRWNDAPISRDAVREVLGEYELTIYFEGPHPLWHEFRGKLSYVVADSFNGNPEALVYAPDHPTKTATVEVTFPDNRPCRGARAFRMEGAGQIPMPTPEISLNGSRLTAILQRPQPGSEYWFWWDW